MEAHYSSASHQGSYGLPKDLKNTEQLHSLLYIWNVIVTNDCKCKRWGNTPTVPATGIPGLPGTGLGAATRFANSDRNVRCAQSRWWKCSRYSSTWVQSEWDWDDIQSAVYLTLGRCVSAWLFLKNLSALNNYLEYNNSIRKSSLQAEIAVVWFNIQATTSLLYKGQCFLFRRIIGYNRFFL